MKKNQFIYNTIIIFVAIVVINGCNSAQTEKTTYTFDTTNMIFFKGGLHISKDIKKKTVAQVEIPDFYLDKSPVTVAEFHALVIAKNYKTQAENFGNSGVFLYENKEWQMIDGAYYLYPFGKENQRAADNHPVTQVSWNDAKWYCECIGKRLPSRYEWEYAARYGNKDKNTLYAWGNDTTQGNEFLANFWQGDFPDTNTIADGFLYTAPVGIFGKTNTGLTDMGGNVWQWCLEDYTITDENGKIITHKIMKGGSYLCDPKYCHGFLIDNYSYCSPETGLSHVGFRCAATK